MDVFSEIIFYFSDRVKRVLNRIPREKRDSIHEIRLRAGKPLAVCSFGEMHFITEQGGICDFAQLSFTVLPEDVEYSFNAVCQYSIYSFGREISEGFITVKGGHRVGLCGTAVYSEGSRTLRDISSLNFRIARQLRGCAAEIFDRYFSEGRLCSLLIAGPPASGKTTVLRDLCRLIGARRSVALVDERSEIAATYRGAAQNDIGFCTDVLDGYNKAEGMENALRVLAPRVIICDEIGGERDSEAILSAAGSGVYIVASAHAPDLYELRERKGIKRLLRRGVFDDVLFLGSGEDTGKIISCGEAEQWVR